MRGCVSYDVLARITIGTLCRAVVNGIRRPARWSIPPYFVTAGLVGPEKNIVYFNYGRNALYTLFQEKFKGREVIFPGFICPSIVWAAIKAGVKPHLVDVSLADFNLDFNLLSDEGMESAGAVFVNHTFGVPADMKRIPSRFSGSRIYLIEDVAQALFARYQGKYVGTFGDSVLLSMYKQIPNFNGAILLSDWKITEPAKATISVGDLTRLLWLTSGPHHYFLKILRQWKGLPESPDELPWGEMPRQPSPLSLSLFVALLPTLKDSVGRKQIVAKHYQRRALESKYFIAQQIDTGKEPSWFNFSVRLLPEIAHIRDRLLLALRRKGIFGDRLWHDSPVTRDFFQEYLKGDCPNAKLLAKSVINLPIKAEYQEKDVNYLFDAVERMTQRLI